jgi:diguanylate cyclase (GGDEF)-like protein
MGLMLREVNYLYLAGYILTGILCSLNQYGPAMAFVSDFPPETTDFLRRFSYSAGLVFATLLARNLFTTPVSFPRADRVLMMLIPCHLLQWTLSGVAGPLLFHAVRYFLSDATLLLLVVIGTASCWVRGFSPARFLIAAFLVHGASVLLGMASTYDAVDMTPVTEIFIPSALDSAALIAFSLALADNVTRLRIENRALTLTERRLRSLSYTDPLTGVHNRRYMESKMKSEVEHSRRIGRELSVIVMDVDHFKRFNDRYGHPEGDRVLKALGEVLRASVRDMDSACRFGGEEFVVLLPDTNPRGACLLAERTRVGFEDATSALVPPGTRTCTLSAGVAGLQAGEDGQGVLKRADEALYEAKASGRNRSVIAGGTPCPGTGAVGDRPALGS